MVFRIFANPIYNASQVHYDLSSEGMPREVQRDLKADNLHGNGGTGAQTESTAGTATPKGRNLKR